MNFNKKICFIFFLWVALFCFLLKLGIFFFIGELKGLSQSIILQRKVQNLLESRIEDFKGFQKNYSFYYPVFEKIENSFVDKEAPIEFIEFLEKEAKDANLSIKISPLAVDSGKKETWISMGFQVLLQGNFLNSLRFLERLEQCPWLVEILQVKIEKISENGKIGEPKNLETNNAQFSLEIKVFSR